MPPDQDDDIKVKQLLDGGATLDDVVDAATQRELARWFALPSFDKVVVGQVEAGIQDPEILAVIERRAKACAAVDPVLLEAIRVRTEVEPATLLKHDYHVALRVDPSIAQFDHAMAERAYRIAEPREVELSDELKDDLRECAPQALLRDLHRPELVFEKLFEVIDYAAEQRLDIVAEVDQAMKMNLKLPPLARSPFSEEHALLVKDRANRRLPWTDIPLRHRPAEGKPDHE